MDPHPRKAMSLKRRISHGAVRLCLPPLQGPPTFIAHLIESHEYRRDRRRVAEQSKAYDVPPPPPMGRIRPSERFQIESLHNPYERRNTVARSGVFGSMRNRKRRHPNDGSEGSRTGSHPTSTNTTTTTTVIEEPEQEEDEYVLWKAADQHYTDSRSRSFLLLDTWNAWNSWQEENSIDWSTRQWDFVRGSLGDPLVMSLNPLLRSDDPWLLPPISKMV